MGKKTIHMNARIQGFPFEYCSEIILFTAVSGFNVVAVGVYSIIMNNVTPSFPVVACNCERI